MGATSSPRYIQRRSRPRFSARPFVLTICAISILTLSAWALRDRRSSPTLSAFPDSRKRALIARDEECRFVHQAEDKCAFVQNNCPDEEAGIFSYLTLYYCRLPHAQPVAFIIIVLWLSLLFSTIGIAASDFFCVNLSTIANLLGMSESMAGVTFLAFGNGSPDVFSTFAAMSSNSASLAIGELIGAAGFITAVVAGSMALVRPFKVARKSFVRDVCFFIFAASFSMGFIWDGKLSLWESATMVGFYIFYVCFVVVWHWWLGRRRARRRRSAAMRSHFITPGGEEEEIPQEYHDEDDGPATTEGARTPAGNVSTDDFSALERAGEDDSIEEDENEQVRERWLGELSNNMRINRPPARARRNTHTPIRPSLVGALEFRAVLTSLQRSRNIQAMPINLRRYSDDPTYTTAQQQDLISNGFDPAPRPPYEVPPEQSDLTPQVSRPAADVHPGGRARAVSTNDMANKKLDPEAVYPSAVPSIDLDPGSPEEDRQRPLSSNVPPSPTISLSPPPSEHSSRTTSPDPATRGHVASDRLAPPGLDTHRPQPSPQSSTSVSPLSSPIIRPSAKGSTRPQPKLLIPGASSPPIPFPQYSDHSVSAHSPSRAPSLRLPSPSASPESYFHADDYLRAKDQARPPRWWPSILPPPRLLLATLFPTLANWRDKSIWEKLLGIVAAPSVFLLTITLPVVETQRDDDDDDTDELSRAPSLSLSNTLTPVTASGSLSAHQRSMVTLLDSDLPHGTRVSTPKSASGPQRHAGNNHGRINQPPQLTITTDDHIMLSPEQLPSDSGLSEPRQWNRWLVIIQAFTAPFFVVFIVWANTEVERPRALLRPTLYSLIFSLILLAIILTTTTPSRPPQWRTLMCFMGFAVSIAWISSIANEVVGVLKTLGVILNMSDAILGLTIFAVGNSLGDFVADITVARLGFPVMALSACFGGPMLNILLGIGISGCYITIKGGRHRHEKHPDKPIKFKPYHIEINNTLIISGATLLVTLVGLLFAVPMRKWKMDRVIGWGLVALWTASTVVNVIVEVLGLSSSVS